ncbi:MAG: hypothetical protein LQ346_007947 [Caloplaca aetnensis]|nr:MAG: hypothetical protein LQ346_007947 [Caloplaca aetnensis]
MPSLPSFITTCVRLSKDINDVASARLGVHDSLLSTILWAFGKLIPQHPRTFKPFLDQIRALVLPLTAPTPSNLSLDRHAAQDSFKTCSEILAQRARYIFVLVNTRALKSSSSQEWEGSLSHMISAAHQTADRVFRGVSEDWNSDSWNNFLKASVDSSLEGICQTSDGESEWPGWTGIHAGLERLNGHLSTIYMYLSSPTPTPVAVPVFKLVGLIDRMLSVLPPSGRGTKDAASKGTQTRPEISRDEREAVWTWLPSIHVSVIQILQQLVIRLGEGSMSLHQQLLSLTIWTFEHERVHVDIRKAVYRILPQLIARSKPGLHRSIASALSACLHVCCDDLLPPRAGTNSAQDNAASTDMALNNDSANAEAYLKKNDSTPTCSGTLSDLQELAAKLLCAALEDLPSGFLSSPLRSKIDQTAVLTQNMRLLQSSVLNPPSKPGRKMQSSVMPLLARQFPQSPCTEALLRPRMPLVQLKTDDDPQESDEELDEREDTVGRNPRGSLTTPKGGMEGDLRKNPANDWSEALTIGLNQVGDPQTEGQPSIVDPQMSPAHEPEVVLPAKRAREPDSKSPNGTVSDDLEQLILPSSEPDRKRMRNDDSGVYVPPTTEDDVPPPVALQPETSAPLALDISDSAEPMSNLGKGNENLNDNDSDDSSIPPIDPTMDTEDEEDEDSDNE